MIRTGVILQGHWIAIIINNTPIQYIATAVHIIKLLN